MNRPLRVFLCHSSNDKPAVRELYQKLRAEPWIQPWLDEEELYPGQDWDMEIEKAVEASDAVLVCLSNNSINKKGYVQKELRFVLDIALEIPEEEIFIVPLRLEECAPPRSLREWQYADYFPESQREYAFRKLLVSLKTRAKSLGLGEIEPPVSKEKKPIIDAYFEEVYARAKEARTRIKKPSEVSESENSTVEEKQLFSELQKPTQVAISPSKATLSNNMGFICVPAAKFLMGGDVEGRESKHIFDIPYDYWMAQYPVTNKLYSEYAKAKGIKYTVDDRVKKNIHPVVNITWNNAMAYCKWLNNMFKSELPLGLVLRLPTEAEWEKAARGTDGREYPWGNHFDDKKCNSSEGKKSNTTPVGLYSPQGDSQYGCADMAGNVWEWTHSLYKSYPYKVDDGREDENTSSDHVMRGGSFTLDMRSARCACRRVHCTSYFLRYVGFRVCLAPPLPS